MATIMITRRKATTLTATAVTVPFEGRLAGTFVDDSVGGYITRCVYTKLNAHVHTYAKSQQ